MFDQQVHTRNRSQFPEAELAKYYGRCVAWSFDGTQILASAPTWSGLSRELSRLGITEYVGAYIDTDPPNWDNYLDDPDAEAAILARDPSSRAG